MPPVTKAWWKEKAVYQIWPASFCDSNGDGVGDIPGIISKLDYIRDLGTEIVWLSPFFKSPQVDMGYDVSDYQDIHEAYGTLDDVAALTAGCHERGIKLIFDLVVNHTSDHHAWFQESKSSTTNLRRNWYVWRKGTIDPQTGERQPPNNWKSVFQGSAWEYDEASDEYYLHFFCKEQPDLNWHCPELRQAIYSMMRWWLDRGCDGFRIDAIHLISKPEDFRDAPITVPGAKYQAAEKLCAYGPKMKDYIREMNAATFDRYDCLNVGEMSSSYDPDLIAPFSIPSENLFQMFFHFELVTMDTNEAGADIMEDGPWTLPDMKRIMGKWQTELIRRGGWNALFLENHDQARSISRLASDKPEFREASGKLLAMLLISLCGTVYIYMGQELGQKNVDPGWGTIEDFKDVASVNWYKDRLNRGDGTEAELLQMLEHKSRDNARTPMQWSSEEHAGFTSGEPWMKLHGDYPEWNATHLAASPTSVLNFWRTLLRLRKENHVLIYGDFTDLAPNHQQIFAYIRSFEEEGTRALVVLNFSGAKVEWKVPVGWEKSRLLVGNAEGSREIARGAVEMQAYEGRIYLA